MWTKLHTEDASELYQDLDTRTVSEIVDVMNTADKTVAFAVERAREDIVKAVNLVVSKMQTGGRLIYIGAGTSGRLGVLDAAECPPTFNTPPDLVQAIIAGGERAMFEAVEQAEDQFADADVELSSCNLSSFDVVVGVTASGRTPFVIGALDYARSVGASTVALACNPDSEVSAHADVAIEVDTGPEVLMGSTRLKAGTAEKMVLNIISTATMIRLGKVYRNLLVDLRATNHKLVERSKRIHMLVTGSTYEEAEKALMTAEGNLKAAILVTQAGVTKETAEHLLERANGFLRVALETALGLEKAE
ncbi:N-acetylmuramic acid 6-phosphate etherase [Alicyclobacillus mengziensis]|uniref:N-acetylmuramic acid 6-phosphate etherase n=1 Tax=Alicyclobacillus mengziensis TaxID=2931921 RepID=A0A9X7Z9U2_9BACL|nr:N-acetylmuramic acid 6-phosphate etherase [Alicyclobacillus mengziensis]QSO50073.1 N-acetylmuramic acid 6-phosphate etherase [Alicyclobacillus mengziensis]